MFSCKETDKQKQQNKRINTSSKYETVIKENKNIANPKATKIIKHSITIVFKINTNFNNSKIKFRIEVLKNNSDKDAYD